jgi:Protein of unknown function (DUF2845)
MIFAGMTTPKAGTQQGWRVTKKADSAERHRTENGQVQFIVGKSCAKTAHKGTLFAMNRYLMLLLLLCSGICLADTLRCGNQLVYEGDELFKVEARCGKPAQISRSSMLKFPSVWLNGKLVQLSDQQIAVPVETWVYNFGSSKFMRKLRFEDGVLVSIEMLEYGYTPE